MMLILLKSIHGNNDSERLMQYLRQRDFSGMTGLELAIKSRHVILLRTLLDFLLDAAVGQQLVDSVVRPEPDQDHMSVLQVAYLVSSQPELMQMILNTVSAQMLEELLMLNHNKGRRTILQQSLEEGQHVIASLVLQAVCDQSNGKLLQRILEAEYIEESLDIRTTPLLASVGGTTVSCFKQLVEAAKQVYQSEEELFTKFLLKQRNAYSQSILFIAVTTDNSDMVQAVLEVLLARPTALVEMLFEREDAGVTPMQYALDTIKHEQWSQVLRRIIDFLEKHRLLDVVEQQHSLQCYLDALKAANSR